MISQIGPIESYLPTLGIEARGGKYYEISCRIRIMNMFLHAGVCMFWPDSSLFVTFYVCVNHTNLEGFGS